MSRENVEVVRRLADAYRRGDRAAALADLDANVVYKRAEEAEVHGPQRVQAEWERWEADRDDLDTIPENFVDAGDRVVVSVCCFAARDARAESAWRVATTRSSPSAAGGSFGGRSSGSARKPSTPRDCRSRQCRGRTWRQPSGTSRDVSPQTLVSCLEDSGFEITRPEPGLVRAVKVGVSRASFVNFHVHKTVAAATAEARQLDVDHAQAGKVVAMLGSMSDEDRTDAQTCLLTSRTLG